MALSGMVSFLNIKNIKLSISSYEPIFAKTPVRLQILVANRFLFSAFLLKLKILNHEIIIPHLKGKNLYYAKVIFPERGKQRIDNVVISSFFPFYFFRRSLILSVNFETIVYPYPLKCDISIFFPEGKFKEESNIAKDKSYDGELVGVKDYINEPLKYIHWKATAKTSELKTKEFSAYRGSPITVDLDRFSGNIEDKVSKATYALLTISKMGNPVGLKLPDRLYKPDTTQAHLRKLLYALALYGKD